MYYGAPRLLGSRVIVPTVADPWTRPRRIGHIGSHTEQSASAEQPPIRPVERRGVSSAATVHRALNRHDLRPPGPPCIHTCTYVRTVLRTYVGRLESTFGTSRPASGHFLRPPHGLGCSRDCHVRGLRGPSACGHGLIRPAGIVDRRIRVQGPAERSWGSVRWAAGRSLSSTLSPERGVGWGLGGILDRGGFCSGFCGTWDRWVHAWSGGRTASLSADAAPAI